MLGIGGQNYTKVIYPKYISYKHRKEVIWADRRYVFGWEAWRSSDP